MTKGKVICTKPPVGTFDKGLRNVADSANINMRFQYKGHKIDETTDTPIWADAQIVITRKRTELYNAVIHGVKPDIELAAAYELLDVKNVKWGKRMRRAQRNNINRTLGIGISRKSKKTWTPITKTKLSDIDMKVVEQLDLDRTSVDGGSEVMWNAEMATLKRVMKLAKLRGYRVCDVDEIDWEWREIENERLRIMTVEEFDRIKSHLCEDDCDYVNFLALTGVRPMEAAALQWDNVKIKARLMHMKNTKTNKIIEKRMDDSLLELIQKRDDAPNRCGTWVFKSPKIKGQHRSSNIEWWTKACTLAGVNTKAEIAKIVNNGEALVLYHIRHFYAHSLASSSKMTLEQIGKQMSHRDSRSTSRYIRSLKNDEAETATNVMGGLLSCNKSNQNNNSLGA